MRGAPTVPTVPNGATRETAIPEWRARLGHYDSTVTRSRKGRTSYRVTARRPRHMIGADSFGAVTGASNYDVRGWADEWVRYQCALALADGWVNESRDIAATFLPLLGTDAMSWEQLTYADASAIDRHGVARHRADITGGYFTSRDDIVRVVRGRRADGTPYRMIDRGRFGDAYSDRRVVRTTVARHVPRYRLTRVESARRRTTIHTSVLGPVVDLGRADRSDTPEWTRATITRLVSPSTVDGMVWHGLRLVPIADVAPSTGRQGKRDASRKVAREARRAPWADVADVVRPLIGAAGSYDVHGCRLMLGAPGATGRFRATVTYADGTTRTIQSRTADPVARALVMVD
jgi:hypothetical protein